MPRELKQPRMRRHVRFAAGLSLGGVALAAYLWFVGPEQVVERITAIAPAIVAVVFCLVVAEAVVDGIGVWASVEPLGEGLSVRRSVQFALAGDFFDAVSPAGPVSSELVMARFFGVETTTSYSEALGVRSVAKYVKSGAQLAVSALLVVVFVVANPAPRLVVVTLAGAGVVLLAVGGLLLVARERTTRVLIAVLSPVLAGITGLYRETPLGRDAVTAAFDRFWARALSFREAPGLVGLIAVGGIAEQLLTAAALWVALAGTGSVVPLVPVAAIVPLPQAASVVPIPGSVGAYDLLLGGALVLMTGVPAAGAAAAVLVVRTLTFAVSLTGGGIATAFLRGWRPRLGG
jgi:uncharacterized membrane protein YbhN (UPF0104 family)